MNDQTGSEDKYDIQGCSKIEPIMLNKIYLNGTHSSLTSYVTHF